MNQIEHIDCAQSVDCNQFDTCELIPTVSPEEQFMGKRFFFSVGEPSGDLHAANLIRCMRGLSPGSSFRGFGGPKMIQSGLDLDFDLTSMAVMGFAEVLPKLREFFRLADRAEQSFANGEVDGVILVDFPGFNWHIAKRAKKYGLPVFYYLPPQLWAWGGWRVRKMRKYVDHVFCNLPFETPWFEKHGVSATFVGHPFFDSIAQQRLDSRFIERHRRNDRIQVSVLPGSRDHEVKHIWPLQLQVIRQLARRFPNAEFMVAALKDSHALWCKSHLTEQDSKLPISIFAGKTSEILEASDCTLMKSGSVSLEVMARGKPAVVMYHLKRSTYYMAKALVKIDSMSLPNLIASEKLLPESLSYGSLDSASSKRSIANVVAEMCTLIGDTQARLDRRKRLLDLAAEFAQPGASYNTAKLMLQRMSGSSDVTLPIDESALAPLPTLKRAA
ncbi:lipid-A-disaccharide synthase [Pirellulaceae bacterium SH449]